MPFLEVIFVRFHVDTEQIQRGPGLYQEGKIEINLLRQSTKRR